MRCSIARVRVLSIPAFAALLPLTLTGCDKLSPSGTSDTMALLRAGSEKICVASDVQTTLKNLILPKLADIRDEAPEEDKLAALAKVSLAFTLTTLQQFDKAVAKATCSTTVEMSGLGKEPVKAQVTFEVTPAAENPNSFIVSGQTDQAQTYASLMVTAALRQLATARTQQQEAASQAQVAAQQAQLDARVRATVSERWLKGVWILDDAGSASCATSAAVRFQDGHVLTGALANGRWALSGTELHLVGSRDGQPVDERYRFNAADAVSGSAAMDDTDASFDLRRCTAAEIHAPAVPIAPVEAGSEQGPR